MVVMLKAMDLVSVENILSINITVSVMSNEYHGFSNHNIINENIQALYLWEVSAADHWFLLTMGQQCGYSWWHHQMETFSMLLALSAGNSPVISEFSSQRPLMQRFDVLFVLCLHIWLSKQWRHRWFEMPSHSLWLHCNVCSCHDVIMKISCLIRWSPKNDTNKTARNLQLALLRRIMCLKQKGQDSYKTMVTDQGHS